MGGAAIGWGLAGLAFVVGYWQYGWRGVVLAATVVAFWLLLQFSRALRVLRQASARPVGNIANAVMLQARLRRGMRLSDVIALTGSLGRKLGEAPETFGWQDAGGDRVEVEFDDGRSTQWRLVRATPEVPVSPDGAGVP